MTAMLRSVTSTATIALLLIGLLLPTATAEAAPPAGAVFVGTNHNNTSDRSEPANQVAMYVRGPDGRLDLRGYFDTGGQGSGPGKRFAGDGLGAGGSVTLSHDRRFLFVANAGSNDVTVFRVHRDRLERTDVVKTGDGSRGQRFPNSVTQHGNLVYVLNSADQGSIVGFRLSNAGTLTPIRGSRRTLDANQRRFPPDALYNPTQVSFTPDGRQLVVTIKDGPSADLVPGVEPTGPGRVLVWSMTGDVPAASYTRTDLGFRGPFGFSFDRHGNMLVALFVGGPLEDLGGTPVPTGAAGSYRINADGTLTAITDGEFDHQFDTCWVVNNGRYAFGANYTSGTVSSFRVGNDGQLTLLERAAGTTEDPGNAQGTTPLDAAVSGNGRFLYVVLPGAGKVGAWRIGSDGRLHKLGEFPGLPRTIDGDQAPMDFSALGSPAGIAAL